MIMLTGVRLLIFAIIIVISATWLCMDTSIDGAQYLTLMGLVIALIGGKEVMKYNELKNGGNKT